MIVLNGGSYYPESREVDEHWCSRLRKNDPIAFIPAATLRSQEEYFEFFRSKMQAYGLTNLLFIDLFSEWQAVRECKAVYIAGGSTSKLIEIMRKSGFSEYLQHERTRPILIGNSAGAVVLGKDIRSSNDSDLDRLPDTRGLGLVDFSICPHFDQDKGPRLQRLSLLLQHRVVGIPEQSALAITDRETRFGPIHNFLP